MNPIPPARPSPRLSARTPSFSPDDAAAADFEVMEDEAGHEVRFENPGTLSMGDVDYAVMAPAEQTPGEPREINIFAITRDDDRNPSYGIEDEELFAELTGYARGISKGWLIYGEN